MDLQEADAVVIGAGALGASAAYHLTRRGIGRVALLDKYELASQNSRRAAGLTSQVRGTDVMTRLAMMSVQAVSRFAEEVGEPMVFHQTGSMKIARRPRDEEQIRREVARGQRLGIEIDLLSPSEAKRIVPYLETTGIRAISYTPSDIYLEPSQLPLGFARAAERRGASLMPRTAVTGIDVENGAVTGVLTERGRIATPIVVDAAGAWSRLVGAMGGARLPIVPTRHQLIVSDAIAGVEPTQPIVRVIDANIYIRPEGNGLLVGGYESNPVLYDMRDVPAGFQVKDVPLDLAPLETLSASVAEQLPVLGELTVQEHRVGLPTMTPDGRQVVGPVPDVRGLYVASGCCVGGLSISPVLGDGLAEWIVTGKAPFDLDYLAPSRFGKAEWPEAKLRSDCHREYTHRYSSH